MSYATSPAKANHLFWLGRYAERVYTTLALLRSSRDGETDGNRGAVACCFARLGCPLEYGCTEEQAILRFLYDPELAGSLRQSLESAYENSIVLREDLSTESLSYIYLCRGCSIYLFSLVFRGVVEKFRTKLHQIRTEAGGFSLPPAPVPRLRRACKSSQSSPRKRDRAEPLRPRDPLRLPA